MGGTVKPGSRNRVPTITAASCTNTDWNGYPITVTATNPNWSLNYNPASGTATSAANDNAVAGSITNISRFLVTYNGPNAPAR
ncbi:MAG TPA: hypothetical protein VGE38_14490 [Nocardioides sp.]|uniref:hypothetical protein n=1 Tax=Nocardioides sp. TaxID=35761 RepID=UPI002EDA7AC0